MSTSITLDFFQDQGGEDEVVMTNIFRDLESVEYSSNPLVASSNGRTTRDFNGEISSDHNSSGRIDVVNKIDPELPRNFKRMLIILGAIRDKNLSTQLQVQRSIQYMRSIRIFLLMSYSIFILGPVIFRIWIYCIVF